MARSKSYCIPHVLLWPPQDTETSSRGSPSAFLNNTRPTTTEVLLSFSAGSCILGKVIIHRNLKLLVYTGKTKHRSLDHADHTYAHSLTFRADTLQNTICSCFGVVRHYHKKGLFYQSELVYSTVRSYSKLHPDARSSERVGSNSYGIACYKCYAQPYSGGTSNANLRPFHS